jgi:Uncharacterised nucleotidyltransferase
VISALTDVGVRSILLKGPSVARWLYDEDESRIYGDVDLIVAPQTFEKAEEVVASLGFKRWKMGDRLERTHRQRPWYREQDFVVLELHLGFPGIAATHQEVWDELSKASEPLPLGVLGVSAEVPGMPARALLVGVHAANHAAGHALTDLERALRRLPEDIWVQAATLARRLRGEPAFAAGLSLVSEGAELARRLGLGTAVPTETLLKASAPPPTAIGWERFANAPGVAGKSRFIFSQLAPTPDFMRFVDPLGQRGRAWLPVAYLVRPFRLARQAPRGFRAWRDARRRALRN